MKTETEALDGALNALIYGEVLADGTVRVGAGEGAEVETRRPTTASSS